MDKNIKDYRETELKKYVIGNIILVLIGMGKLNPIVRPNGDSSALTIINTVLSSVIFSAIIFVFVFISDALVSSNIKDKVIWLWQGLPGGRVFTSLKKEKDRRISLDVAIQEYSELYKKLDNTKDIKKSKRIQNAYWYWIYQKHENEAQVFIANREYLLCRDMCTITIWIIIGFILLTAYLHMQISFWTLAILIIEFVCVWLATRNKGKRLVLNVIAKDLAMKEKPEKKQLLIE